MRSTGGRRSGSTRYAYGLIGDAAEAQDLTQEAYARAWRRWRTVRAYHEPEAWLRVVRDPPGHGSVAAARSPPGGPVRPYARPNPSSRPPRRRYCSSAALRTLPLVQRRALVLHYLLDHSVADIAHETQTNANTVKSWLARGRARLAAALGDLNPATDENDTAGAMRGEIRDR